MNFIHESHLARATAIFKQERAEKLEYRHCYPSFGLMALTAIVELMKTKTAKDRKTVEMLRQTWDILKEMSGDDRVESHLPLMKNPLSRDDIEAFITAHEIPLADNSGYEVFSTFILS